MIIRYLFLIVLNGYLFISSAHSELICRLCGAPVTTKNDFTDHLSPHSINSYSHNVLGKEVTIQRLINPSDMKFDIITTKKANVMLQEQSYASDSWYPGMRWTLAACNSCHTHLGWHFSAHAPSVKQSFYGLIMDRLVSKDYADSIVMAPGDGRKDTTPVRKFF